MPDEKLANDGGINSPGITARSTEPRVRSVKDGKQAWEIVKRLENANHDRNKKNARIMAKYNAEKPHSQHALEAEGLGWKSNFSTKPLSTLIDKVAPRFTNATDSARYLTSSKLPDNWPKASEKSEAFQREITQTIRARPEWSNLVSEVAMEFALFGYTAVGWTNEFSWMPKHFRQDNFFVPTGTGHDSSTAQLVVFRETILPHELFELISDKEAAASAGWDLAKTANAINNAMPEALRSRFSDQARVYEDLVREASVAASHQDGAKTLVLFHLLAVELTGKVSHYILNSAEGNDVLFQRLDQFDSMSECSRFFSFQQGNGKLHGSKGIGREVYAMASVLDRARNEVVDRLQLSGKLIIKGEEKQLRRFKMSVVGNAILIGSNYEVAEKQIDGKVDSFFTLDQFMTNLLDTMSGNVSPKHLEGDRVTKAQVDLFAAREEESKDSVISRFLSQLSATISVMQRKMVSPHTSEDDAKEMRKRLLLLMSQEELDMLAEQPSAYVVKDFTDLERQQIVLIATENQANPLFNQKELQRRKLTAQIGKAFADAVLLPDEDPTVLAEQTRQEQIELLYMASTASPLPVSPRDNHGIRLEVCKQAVDGAIEPLAQQPADLPKVQAMLAHMKAHVAMGAQAGDQNVSAFAAYIVDIERRLTAFVAHEEAAMAAAEAGLPPEMAGNAGATAAMASQPPPVAA